MSVAIFGGTFDPIHDGHLRVALAVRDRFDLERVLLLPAWCPPHKQGEVLTPWGHRFAMAAIACLEVEAVEASPAEGYLAGTSYTVEMLERFRTDCGPVEPLLFVMGSDSLAELPSWKNYPRILELANLAVAPRPGTGRLRALNALPADIAVRFDEAEPDDAPAAALPPAGRIYWVEMDPVDISGSGVRRRIQEGEKATGLVPDAVATYIARYQLYGKRRDPSRT